MTFSSDMPLCAIQRGKTWKSKAELLIQSLQKFWWQRKAQQAQFLPLKYFNYFSTCKIRKIVYPPNSQETNLKQRCLLSSSLSNTMCTKNLTVHDGIASCQGEIFYKIFSSLLSRTYLLWNLTVFAEKHDTSETAELIL